MKTESDPDPRDGPSTGRPGTLLELFAAFNRLALQGFGGVLPVAHRELVERRRWLDAEGFMELLSLCQLLPGPNVINLSVILGDRWFGWRGALVASAGLLVMPLLIVLGLAGLYQELSGLPQLRGALKGMSVVAAGLIISTALKLTKPLAKNPLGPRLGLFFGALMLTLVGFLRWPMIWALLTLGTAAVGLAYIRLRSARERGAR